MTSGTADGPVGIGIVGAGNISSEYLRNLGAFADTTIVAIGDQLPEVARARAAEFGVPTAGDTDVVLGHPAVEIVVNLTTPAAHADVARRALAAGKHVWNEKPLAADRTSAREVLDAADRAGLRIGCAPDTFLGPGLQTARRLIDDGVIGEPLTALALMQSPGPDAWHPNPAFFFQEGAGPLFDIGPYYLTAFVQLFGPIQRTAAIGSIARATRTVARGPKAGESFPVSTPTHVSALVGFASGRSAQAILSFDSPQPRVLLEVTGADATMIVPDPNTFDGEICVRRRGTQTAERIALIESAASRGTGVLEMARAVRAGTPHRANGALGAHVLDAMVAIRTSIDSGAFEPVESTVERPDLLPPGWDPLARTLGR